MEYVITFDNTNQAIKAENCLLAMHLKVGVMPLPSQISAGCGISLRISPEEIKVALQALALGSIEISRLFSRVSESGRFVYTEVKVEAL